MNIKTRFGNFPYNRVAIKTKSYNFTYDAMSEMIRAIGYHKMEKKIGAIRRITGKVTTFNICKMISCVDTGGIAVCSTTMRSPWLSLSDAFKDLLKKKVSGIGCFDAKGKLVTIDCSEYLKQWDIFDPPHNWKLPDVPPTAKINVKDQWDEKTIFVIFDTILNGGTLEIDEEQTNDGSI